MLAKEWKGPAAVLCLGAAAGVVVLLAQGCLTGRKADAPTHAIRPYVALSGARSLVTKPTYLRVTSAEEWRKVWEQHTGPYQDSQRDLAEHVAPPTIDFEQCMVIAVFQGESVNSMGVVCPGTIEEADRIVCRFDDHSYQTAGPAPDGGAVKVTAWGVFVLPRSAKPLVLEENVCNILGGPPEWKERARFGGL